MDEDSGQENHQPTVFGSTSLLSPYQFSLVNIFRGGKELQSKCSYTKISPHGPWDGSPVLGDIQHPSIRREDRSVYLNVGRVGDQHVPPPPKCGAVPRQIILQGGGGYFFLFIPPSLINFSSLHSSLFKARYLFFSSP